MPLRRRLKRKGRRRWLATRWLLRGLGLLVLLLVLPSLYACVSSAPPPAVTLPGLPAGVSPPIPLYVVDWGYHSAIIVPQPAGWELGPPGEETAPFLEYAWGDRRFYMESNVWPHSVLATLFLPTRAVTYVDGWPRPPALDDRPRGLYTRGITVEQWAALLQELERWIPRDGAGANGVRPPAFPAVKGYDGRFYPGYGTYFWWMDCNRWTVERLQAAGLAGSGRGVVLSGQIAPRLLGFTKVGR
jgi:hypothetical protein